LQIVLSLVKHGSDIDNNIDEANQNMNHIPKMGLPSSVDFHNSDFVKYAGSCGAKGYRIKSAGDLLFFKKCT
jgi:thiamine pyrophosphate-dependent acetolactate synthase large subunit-like protein